MIGLKRGTVELYDHEIEWGENATQTIGKLEDLFGPVAIDIQQVGSTAIIHIKAKPIIDIAVAVNNFNDVHAPISKLDKEGIIHRPEQDSPMQIFFICGQENICTHHIHVVKVNEKEWMNYINFRDYLSAKPHAASEKDLIYSINYGYIEGVMGGDGAELDVYVLGEDEPLDTFTGSVIAIVHRENNVEDKLVACPIIRMDGTKSLEELLKEIEFVW